MCEKICCENPNIRVGKDYKSNEFRYRFFCKNCKKVWFKNGIIIIEDTKRRKKN